MYCKKCGASLPSHGFICKRCGTMMDSEQIKEQKEHLKSEGNGKIEVNFLSDKYSKESINRDYNKKEDNNKYLGGLLIILVLVVLIIFAFLRVM